MLEPVLQTLREVEGVQGALLVDDGARILAARAHAIYDPTMLQQVARSVVNATDAVRLIQDDWDQVTAHFGEGKLLLRHLRMPSNKARRYVLAVIADARLNLAFLGVALRVASSKLIPLLESAPEAALAAGSVPVAVPAATTARIAVPAPAPVATAGLSWSGSGVGGASQVGTQLSAVSDVSVADADASALLSSCSRALAASIGPVAKLLVKEAVRAVCGARAFTRADAPALLARLSTSIPSTEARASFQRATRAL